MYLVIDTVQRNQLIKLSMLMKRTSPWKYPAQKAPAWSPQLAQKLEHLAAAKKPVYLGRVQFSSPLILAPMSGICSSPFRLLMQDLGAGGTVSEFVSCHGINYRNEKSLDMLYIDPREKGIGLQLFGEDPKALALASKEAELWGAEFVDINMGCPVKKVVSKGGGSALLKRAKELGAMLSEIKKEITVPLTIKIRMGWDADEINAHEIVQIAKDSGVEFVAIHGRTRAQGYQGQANWDYIEKLAQSSPLPLIGNGDLHSPFLVRQRLKQTQCPALMIARGALRNPFIFLESLTDLEHVFGPQDYWEVIQRFHFYLGQRFTNERTKLVQLKKHIVWFAAGFPHAAKFRSLVFPCPDEKTVLALTQEYFVSLENSRKQIDYGQVFMAGGHG